MRAAPITIHDIRGWPDVAATRWRKSLTYKELRALQYLWSFWARPEQLEPSWDWNVWLLLAGRGFGKTRVGAEWVRHIADSGRYPRIALVARTAADARDVMIEGESGIMSVCPPSERPLYEPSKRRLTWPNGTLATTYSADTPNALRGPQHHAAWADELAAWSDFDAYDQLMLGLRLGERPRLVVTTTPRPLRALRELRDAPTTHVTTGSTYENAANLSEFFFRTVVAKYEGTSIGQQELHAALLDEAPGALWTRALIERNRIQQLGDLQRIVVSVDPSVTAGSDSDECGIVVVGESQGEQYWVIADASGVLTPSQWARRAVSLYQKYQADLIVGETNQGGDLVETTIRAVAPKVPYRGVHASKGKRLRAEPIAALYEQDRVHHVGAFADLEDQMCGWVPGMGSSPDRLDALVHGLTELSERPGYDLRQGYDGGEADGSKWTFG